MPDLERRFGSMVFPTRRSPAEMQLRPLSMEVLGQGPLTGLLASLTRMPIDDCRAARMIAFEIRVLWLVCADGTVRMALEEVVRSDAAQGSRHPKAANGVLAPGYEKLGHPALVGDAGGRIGGELYRDERPLGWIITNGSGRYSRGLPRRREHLVNVAAEFGTFGIEVTPVFL
ncbi:hypothetical protein C2U72_27175 [Prosthecomicrobium hirschii]|uniref:hypothetical protein n=1 Tax=Prosthecodimorpha hirschii TaxID=665126 RepID=UPI00112ABCF5|nr:hypothetical protein [Prosthecomicrobium hirschii]TPQ44994.1 hypothetical protein C2U72_27175 [Prosthecomicrobium hirschii]